MSEYTKRALFLFTEDAEPLAELCLQNRVGTELTVLALADFFKDPQSALPDIEHVVVAAHLAAIKQVLRLAREHGFCVGIVPMKGQDRLRRYLDLPKDHLDAIDYALQANPKPMDFALCNGELSLFSTVIGWLPGLDASDDLGRWDMLKRLLQQWSRLSLYDYRITTANDRDIRTAATGCMVFERHQGDIISRLIGEELSVRDGKIGMVISSPLSRFEYLRFLYQLFSLLKKKSGLPDSVGYLQSSSFRIEAGKKTDVYVDGALATQTPVQVEVIRDAARVNLGPALMEADRSADDKETVRVSYLPDEEEAERAVGSRVPFFSYASEEHFKELFTTLYDDARINAHFGTLMLLSTFIATLGLYLNSAAVIIGAMILAPLMSPLVSMSMALLRDNRRLLEQSVEKAALGIALALAAAALTSMFFPYEPVTREMAGRLNPSLPDLFVAVFSGIAAAYCRAYKEIAQSLAGVAIAVALVPPLAVAGIGLGRADFWFFGQAFLLFFTNLVGIIVAATLTFRVLGFSPVLRARRKLGAIVVMLALIAIPLGITSSQISERWEAEERLAWERLDINGKPVIITRVERANAGGPADLMITVAVREPLKPGDFEALREQIRDLLGRDARIKLDIHYLL